MSQIRTLYEVEPAFPATDQHPDAERFFIGPYVVDAIGGEPTLAEVEAVLNPPRVATTAVQKLAEIGIDMAELKAELAKV